MMSESARALGEGFDPRQFTTADAAGLDPDIEQPSKLKRTTPPRALPRRQALAWAGALAMAGSLAAFGISASAHGTVYETARGEIRLVPLHDGSTMLLNTASKVRVKYGERKRLVTIDEGEVYFSIAQDTRRPFVVAAGDDRIHTSRAAFRVLKLAERPVDVLVQQGHVVVTPRPGLTNASPLFLPANTHVTLNGRGLGDGKPQPLPPTVVSRELAWRQGKIAFRGETLQHAVNAFARYSDTRIVIRDKALASERVTGLFSANDPAGFSRAVASAFDAQVAQGPNAIVLFRKGSPH